MTTASSKGLTKPNLTESKTIQIAAPLLHIGAEVSQLTPFEFVQTNDRVYLPTVDTLSKLLLKRGKLEDYIYAINHREDLSRLLKQVFGDQWLETTDEEGNPIFPSHLMDYKWTGERIPELRPMIRNKYGQPYIPGSSIKGAIRTAIAYHLLANAEQFNVSPTHRVSAIEKKLQQSMGELKRKAKRFSQQAFMDSVFTDFQLTTQNRYFKVKSGPNTDFMRAIKVSDSQPLRPGQLKREGKTPVNYNQAIAAEVIVSSHFQSGQAKYRASIFAEFVFNLRSTFTLSLDTEMLSWFQHNEGMDLPFQSVEDILRICKNFAQEQWDFEHDYWQTVDNNPNAAGKSLVFDAIQQRYEREKCPYSLRIGWASGMPGTTINTLLKDETAAEIRDRCGLKAPGFEAPKSRRTVVDFRGEIRYPPGWVILKC